MAVPFFWVFITSLLVCSLASGAAASKRVKEYGNSGEKPFLYGLVASLIASITAYLASCISQNAFKVFWLLGGVFLFFGVVHLLWTHQRCFSGYKDRPNRILSAEILFGLSLVLFTLALFASLEYFLKAKDFLLYPLLMSALLFFVPLLFLRSFQAAYHIPATVFLTWQYPLHQQIELPEEDTREKIWVIAFEIAKKASDSKKTFFRAKAPETMKLGDLFYHFINDYNDLHSETTIEYADEEYEPYAWWFRGQARWFQSARVFHPGLSIRENHIKEDTVITCERV